MAIMNEAEMVKKMFDQVIMDMQDGKHMVSEYARFIYDIVRQATHTYQLHRGMVERLSYLHELDVDRQMLDCRGMKIIVDESWETGKEE